MSDAPSENHSLASDAKLQGFDCPECGTPTYLDARHLTEDVEVPILCRQCGHRRDVTVSKPAPDDGGSS